MVSEDGVDAPTTEFNFALSGSTQEYLDVKTYTPTLTYNYSLEAQSVGDCQTLTPLKIPMQVLICGSELVSIVEEGPLRVEYDYLVNTPVIIPEENVTSLFLSTRPECPLTFSLNYPEALEEYQWASVIKMKPDFEIEFTPYGLDKLPIEANVQVNAISMSGAVVKKTITFWMDNWAPYFEEATTDVEVSVSEPL